MSKEGSEQTLIPKDNERRWRKRLHGESVAPDDHEPDVDSAAVRDYLILRDEAVAVTSVAKTDDLSTISEEEARLIYHRASQELQQRKSSRWFEFFKTYGAGALIGGLSVTVLFLFLREPVSPTAGPVNEEGLNYSDYNVLKVAELPGDFPNMLLIPGGTFDAGCSTGWDDVPGGCRPSEFPSHRSSIDTFEISQHEVTVGQFAKFIESTGFETDADRKSRGCVHQDTKAVGQPFVMNAELTWRNPGYEQHDDYPVSCVSWKDAQAYIQWLSKETKTRYRLPTEAEWEYAARGGKSTAYYWGSVADHNQANFAGTGGQDKWEFASPVGRFPANKFSVQDTAGNVWEWVQDCWHKSYNGAPIDGSAWEADCDGSSARVRRGGAWDAKNVGIRSAIRSKGAERDRSNVYGFRVARDWQQLKK